MTKKRARRRRPLNLPGGKLKPGKLRIGKVTTPQPRTGIGAHAGHRETVAQRQAKAMSLRTAGASLAAIGQVCGVSKQQAFRDVAASLAETLAQRDADASAYRELELLRCDEMTVALWPAVRRGDAEAIRAALRVSQRRCALLGLDAAVSAKLELAGAVVTATVATSTATALTKLSNDELRERLRRATEFLLAARGGAEQPEPAPVLSPQKAAEAAYEAQLAERGNSHGPH